MSAVVELSIYPIDKGINLSSYVAKALTIIKNSGIPYQLTPMGTIMEGELRPILDVIADCHDTLRQESDRVIVNVRVDSRLSDCCRMTQKIQSVENKLA